jgi:succinate dehydrogenase / fumarate reductase iron-sulfur subunit
MAEAIFEVFRGDCKGGQTATYRVPIAPGMVVLDALHHIQAHQAPDLAVRWNCKAGKCGSCSAEVNGRPRLTCKTRMDALPLDKPITVHPMKAFPVIKDLVTDVSWNYRVNKKIPPFEPRPGTDWKMYQEDVDRVQEFRKCIECFLCQNVCHVLREHEKMKQFGGPRFLSGWRGSRCILSTQNRARACSRMNSASACAILRSAARKCALRRFRSRIMQSFR